MAESGIRLASASDKPELFRMGRAFYEASGYADMGEWNPALLDGVFDNLIAAECLLIADGGMIGWINFPVFMTGQQVAQELFWWADEDRRGTGVAVDLLKAAEARAKEQGSHAMMMLCLDDLNGNKVAGLYAKMNYRPRERTFMRVL